MTNGHDKADDTTTANVARRDGGATFVELLVSIVLLGVVGVAVLVATSAALAGARTSDEIAKSQASVAEVTDFMTDTDPQNVVYRDCVGFTEAQIRAEYQTTVDARFGAGVVTIDAIRFEDPATAFGSTCHFGDGHRLQRIEFTARLNDSTRDIVLIKRPVEIPTQDTVPAPSVPPYVGGSGQASVTLTPWMSTWP